MPRITRPQECLAPVPALLNSFVCNRLAIGWLVAREAGITPPICPLVGEETPINRWQRAKRLPTGLTALQPTARLVYRLRAMALVLHGHPNATICGGPESWWQHIVDEQLLGALSHHLMPKLIPEMDGVKPRQRTGSAWWMRRGLNPCNPLMEPATWALIEAAQARVFPSRPECVSPADDAPLPLAALNGEMSLHARKNLLGRLTGSREGFRPNQTREIYRDWTSMLAAWQSTATPAHRKHERILVRDSSQYEVVAIAVHDALLPDVWRSIVEIRQDLNDKSSQKASRKRGFNKAEKNEPDRLEVSPQEIFPVTE